MIHYNKLGSLKVSTISSRSEYGRLGPVGEMTSDRSEQFSSWTQVASVYLYIMMTDNTVMILLILDVKNYKVFLIVLRAILKFQVTLYFCGFQPRAEIVHVIVNIFSPFNWAEFKPRVKNSPWNQASLPVYHNHQYCFSIIYRMLFGKVISFHVNLRCLIECGNHDRKPNGKTK